LGVQRSNILQMFKTFGVQGPSGVPQ